VALGAQTAGAGRIDLNADVGEGLGPEKDRALMAQVSSVSIACGGHAGDAQSMASTVASAQELGLRIGAHPSYPDRPGFGRTTMAIAAGDLRSAIEAQVLSLVGIAGRLGAKVSYLKPHGALYNDAARDPSLFELIRELGDELGLPVMTLASRLGARKESQSEPVPFDPIREGFIDRGYAADGSLIPRSEPGALIKDPAQAAAQAVRLAPCVDSLCVHSDTPDALSLITAARRALLGAGCGIGW
jgi:5-oxoprolinase (ATP-hydrolysing) subunit A